MGASLLSLSTRLTLEKSVPKVDWLQDRIKPTVEFTMPDKGKVEFSLGIFLPSSPTRRDSELGIVRDIEAYDKTVILDTDKFTERYSITAGTTYEQAITDILVSAGVNEINIEFNSATVSKVREFGVGTTKLEAINELLTELNFVPIWVDSDGYFRSYPYEKPTDRASEYTYTDEELSIISKGIDEELDLFDIANVWSVTVSNPEELPMTAMKENSNPDLITSIPNRGNRRIVDYREVDNISSQESLNGYVERIASEASQIYGKIKFKTPIMPFHEYYDKYRLVYTPLDINEEFTETNWSIDLTAGSMMEHEVRRVVDIG